MILSDMARLPRFDLAGVPQHVKKVSGTISSWTFRPVGRLPAAQQTFVEG